MTGKYISSFLMGGLGNQLFQISHALCQGLRHNRNVIFQPTSTTNLQGNNAKIYVDNIFRNLNFQNQLLEYEVINEKSFGFSEINPSNNNTIFNGYFQSSKYFFGYDDYIKKIFEPKEDFVSKMYDKYPSLMTDNTLSLHIRRGDYLSHPSIHPTISLSYIDQSLKKIDNYTSVFIFSDDKLYIKDNLRLDSMIIVDEPYDYEELWLMSMCKNNIICNSTFSWWGSFLNKNINKKIIAPSKWFGQNGPPDYMDIYENYWTIINVENKNGNLEYVT